MPTAVKLIIEDDDVVEENDIDEKDDKSEPESDSAAPGLWPALWSAGDDDDDNDEAKSAPGKSAEEAELGIVVGCLSGKVGEYLDAKKADLEARIERRFVLPGWIERLIHIVVNENRWIGNNASDRPPPRRATRTSSSSGLP